MPHWLRALPVVMNLFRDLKVLSIGGWDFTLGLRIALVCLRPGFAWRECITIVKTSPNSDMAIGMMYAAQKMRKRTIFSTPIAPSPRLKNGELTLPAVIGSNAPQSILVE
jgi:hypothetical protein